MTFLPHGTCLLWNRPLLAVHVVSDAVVAIAYFMIAATLIFFVRRRRDLAFSRIVFMFGAFIAACAWTHIFDIVTIYYPAFWPQGIMKALTAIISFSTAIALIPIIPKLLAMRNPEELASVNSLLRASVEEKDQLLSMYQREHRIAREFQSASLPQSLPEIPGLTFSSVYDSGNSELTIGGDWYDAMRLVDGRIVLSIGDVIGSGLSAAVVMSNVRQVLRGVAQLHPDPVLMLDAADRALREDHASTLVTAFVAVIDPVSMTITYASAGHPAPYLLHAGGEVEELNYRGMMLGLRRYNDPASHTKELSFGSTLVMYTDGLIEATRDASEGEQRLRASFALLEHTDPKNLAPAIHDYVLDREASDDIAILTLHIEDREDSFSRYRFHTSNERDASRARLSFVDGLRLRNASAEELFSAELVFGELLGNVVRYAPGMVEIVVDWSGRIPVLHVSDQGPGFWHIPKLPSDLLSESGRGLFLVKELTADFTVSKKRAGGSHARAVLQIASELGGLAAATAATT